MKLHDNWSYLGTVSKKPGGHAYVRPDGQAYLLPLPKEAIKEDGLVLDDGVRIQCLVNRHDQIEQIISA